MPCKFSLQKNLLKIAAIKSTINHNDSEFKGFTKTKN